MNDIFTSTFEKHKRLVLESLNDYNWEEKADWSVFDTQIDTSRSFDKEILGVTEATTPTQKPKLQIQSFPTKEYWEMYDDLPEHIKANANEKFKLFVKNPSDPSLGFKPLSLLTNANYWVVSLNANYRVVGIKTDIPNGFKMVWIFIGNHNQYDAWWKRKLKNK